jgi:hypothetical protein
MKRRILHLVRLTQRDSQIHDSHAPAPLPRIRWYA